MTVSITSINSNTELEEGYDVYLIDATLGNLTITLPVISSDGEDFSMSRVDSTVNSVTVEGTSQNINGFASVDLPIQQSLKVVSYLDNWYSYL